MNAIATPTLENFVLTDIDNTFLQKVLQPYRLHCQYLKRAYFQEQEDQGVQGLVLNGEFSIPDSCYIDDTGHFNAVEFNICYNQMTYAHLSHSIIHGLIPELGDFDESAFFEKQLSHFLIVNLNSSFQSMLNAKHFYGSFGIHSLKRTSKCTFIKTYCHFHDDYAGKCKGEITLAVLRP